MTQPDGPAASVGVADEVLHARLYLNRVAEPANLPVWAYVRAVGPVEAADRIRAGAAPEPVDGATRSRRTVDGSAGLDVAHRLGIRPVVPESPDWPHFAFGCLEHAGAARWQEYAACPHRHARQGEPVPPLMLWVRGPGELATLATCSVGIIGARAATGYGEHVARGFGRGLAEHDVTVVSGGAFGIDAAAHRGALAARGDTVLVSAGGLDGCYPPGNERLFAAVAETGLLVSESPPDSAPQRRRFLTRNRLVAALSSGTVVVEAALRSGALNTVGHCNRLGRPIMAVPGSVESTMSGGTHHVLRHPAWSATLVTCVADVLEVIGAGPATVWDEPAGSDWASGRAGAGSAATPGGSSAPVGACAPGTVGRGRHRVRRILDGLDPCSREVFDAFPGERAVTVDELVIESGLGVSEVVRSLPVLELAGLVAPSPDGFRIRVGSGDA